MEFWVGVANPQCWGRGGCRGSGMGSFERALVSSYRLPIVTFPLSLRVSEILSLLCSCTLLFLTNSSLPNISPCSPGSRWMALGLRRAKVLGELSVQLVSTISNLCDLIHQRHRRTDRQTTCDRNTALCTIAHRAVKIPK